jgi:putative endonuclease
MAAEHVWWVYILECSDGNSYVGSTRNLAGRTETHQSGKGPKYTALRRPIRLVYSEQHTTLTAAVQRDRQIKGWTRAKKIALIAGNLSKLHALSRRSQEKQNKLLPLRCN